MLLCVIALGSQSAGGHLNTPAALQEGTHNICYWQIYCDKKKKMVSAFSTGAECRVRHTLCWNQACSVLLFTKPDWPCVHVNLCLLTPIRTAALPLMNSDKQAPMCRPNTSENTHETSSRWMLTMRKRRASAKPLWRLRNTIRDSIKLFVQR